MSKLILSLALILGLAACAPVADPAREAITAIGRGADGATLALTASTVTFDPGPAIAYAVVIYAGGVGVATTDPRCEPLRLGIACFPGDLEAPVELAIAGATSANVSYYREGRAAPLFFYVVTP